MSFPLFEVRRRETEEYLKRLYEQGEGDRYILSFSVVNKYGINVKPLDKTTPLGVYGYLLKHLFLYYDGNIRKLPFGTNRPYILLLKIKPNAKVLVTSKITHSDVEKLLEYLFRHVNDFLREEIKKVLYKNIAPPNHFFTLLSYVPNIFKTTSTGREHILLRNTLVNLGYDIVIDDGMRLIHNIEPYQVVILNLNKAEHVDTLYNPYAKLKPKDEEDYRVVYHRVIDPINAFIFTVLKNRLNLNDKRITDNLFFLLKKLNPSITTEIYEQFLSEIKPIIKKIYDQYDEQNYNPIEATLKYLPNFKFELIDLLRKYHLGEFSPKEVQFMMHNYLLDRNWKKYIDLFPVDVKNTLNGNLFLKDLIVHSIRFQLNKETITKLAEWIYKNWKMINSSIPLSINITILKMSRNKEHHDFADSLIEKISPFPSFSLEMIEKIIDILQSKQIPLEKIANLVAAFLSSSGLTRFITQIQTEYRDKDFYDKKHLLQWIVVKLRKFINKITGNLLVQDEKNLLIKTAAKRLLYKLNNYTSE